MHDFNILQSILEDIYIPGGESLIWLRSLGENDEGLIQGPVVE